MRNNEISECPNFHETPGILWTFYHYTKTSKASKNRRLGCRRFQKSTLSRFSGFSRVIREIPGNIISIIYPGIVPVWINIYFGQIPLQTQEIYIFSFFDSVTEVKKLMFLALFSLKIFRRYQISTLSRPTLSRSWCTSFFIS